MSTRRILYMQPSELFGGAERQIATVLPELQRQGAEVTALVGPGRTIVEWLQKAGVSDVVHSWSFPRDDSDVHGFEVLAYPGEFLAKAHAAEREVEALIENRKIEVVLAGMAFSWLSATPAARHQGVPVIWRAGGMELSALQRTVLPLWARRNPPDALIGNGDAVREMFSPLIPAPAYVVRNGVDTHLFRPGAAKGTMRPAGVGPVIGFAGRLAPQKRPQDFLAMAARIAARHPEVQFLLAGEGSRRPSYERLASRLGISARVRFLGQVEDMRAFYASCDLLVLPSRSEGSPNVVLEAMAMRLAVVASDTPATREVVTHLHDGILFPVGDVDKLTDAVDLSVSLPELRTMLAARALRKVRGPLSAAASAATLSDVFESVLQGSGPRREVAIPAVAAAAAVAAVG